MKTIFREPSGKRKFLSSLCEIQDIILNQGDEYWYSGSGDATLTDRENQKCTLILIFCDGLGFYLEYISPESKNNSFVVIGEEEKVGYATVNVGGEGHHLPLSTFNSRLDTLKIVDYFLKTGSRDEKYIWLQRSELQWYSDEEE